MYAMSQRRRADIFDLLIENGASLDLVNSQLKSIKDYARDRNILGLNKLSSNL